MSRCTKCGYFIGASSSLGSCYCGDGSYGHLSRHFTNVHEIESFQAYNLAGQKMECLLKYQEKPSGYGGDVEFASFQTWFTHVWHPLRMIELTFLSGWSKMVSCPEFVRIVVNDGFMEDGLFR